MGVAFSPSNWKMAAATGEAHRGERREEPRQREDRERPQQRSAFEPQGFGEIREDPPLHVVDQLKKTPRRERRHDADGAGKGKQDAELFAAKDRPWFQLGSGDVRRAALVALGHPVNPNRYVAV